MKKLLGWISAALLWMVGIPWLTVKFAGSAGMAICFILFFAADPLFCALCGIYAGRNVRQLWPLPLIAAGLFLAGAWLCFEMSETAFVLYSGCYLLIGMIGMLISAFVNRKKCKK